MYKIKSIFYSWITNLTNFLIFCSIVFGFFSSFVFFYFSAENAMFFCRGFSIIGAIFLCICSWILLKNIFSHQNYGGLEQTYIVSITIKLFIFVMTIISIGGYFLLIPYTYILEEYDFALKYRYFWEVIFADGFYIFAIIAYLLIQLFYLWFFLPIYGFFEDRNQRYKKFIFGFTLIINFWQKWLFETLIAREEICEELFLKNRLCAYHRNYSTNISMLSEAEQKAYHLIIMITPLSYSCTIEILAVYAIVLCYCKRKKKNEMTKIFRHPLKPFSVNSKLANILKIVMAFILFLVLLCMTEHVITMYDDEHHPRIFEKNFYRSVKLASLIIACVVYCVIFKIYKHVKPKVLESTKQSSGENKCFSEVKCCFKGSEIFSICSTKSEPDLLILQITWWITLIMSFTKIILQSYDYIYGNFLETDKLIFLIFHDIVAIISFAFNFKLLNRFLTCNSNIFEELSHDRFTTHFLIPNQIIRCFLHAMNRLIGSLNPQPSLLSHDTIDQWITLLNAAYPFFPLMNITSALCWAHVMEKFFSLQTYNPIILYKSKLKRRNSFIW